VKQFARTERSFYVCPALINALAIAAYEGANVIGGLQCHDSSKKSLLCFVQTLPESSGDKGTEKETLRQKDVIRRSLHLLPLGVNKKKFQQAVLIGKIAWQMREQPYRGADAFQNRDTH
ncbi:hypothetical protein BIW11_10609, partial [Tropilaelaps mercedesae]